MVYMKYILSKTGWFPKWERGIEDVLNAASMVYDVKDVVTPRRNRYYYVIPNDYNIRHMWDMLRVFRANGVILRPHRSGNYNSLVFRVPNHGQRFMRDVMRVSQDADNFQKVLSEHKIDVPDNKTLKMFQKFKMQQYR